MALKHQQEEMGFTERGAAGGKVMRPKDSDVFDEKGQHVTETRQVRGRNETYNAYSVTDVNVANLRDRKAPGEGRSARLPPEVSGQTPGRETVALDKLVTDGGTQVCSQISEFIVTEYVEALGEGARFPPVVVFRADGADVLADGFHRVRAYQQAGRDEIEADVYEGGPAAALWFALGANRPHGQRLTDGDKQRAIEMAYKAWPDVSQRRIAAHVGCSHQYVGIVRGQLAPTGKLPDTVVGRDGRRRPATRPARKRVAASAEDDAPPAIPSEQADTQTDSPEASNAQASAGSENKGADRDPEPPEQEPVEPPGETSSRSDPRRPEGDRSGTGVTAKQSARDRSNRIVSLVADNAKNLTAQEDLIDFAALDGEQLPQWIEDLEQACRPLRRFIRRLRKEV